MGATGLMIEALELRRSLNGTEAVSGVGFSLPLGLFFGSVFSTASATGAGAGLVSIIYIIGGLFFGPPGQIVGNGPVLPIVRLLPTYSLVEGVVNASENLGTWGNHLVDLGVILGGSLVLLAISAWALRRRSAVLALI